MGEVVRSEALDSVKEGGHYGIGVRFIAISDIDLEIISTKVAEHLESEGIDWREEEPEKKANTNCYEYRKTATS
jgi:hypothetical protein